MRALAVAATVVLVLWAIAAKAEPGPRVQSLIDKPVSMFTFGMYRLDQFFTEEFGYEGARSKYDPPLYGVMSFGTAASYDWTANRITLWLLRFTDTPSGWDVDEECRQAIKAVRERGLIDPSTGGPLQGSSSYLGQMFQPIGYGSKDLEGVAEAMDDIIEIRVQTPEYLCSAPLRGTRFSVEKR